MSEEGKEALNQKISQLQKGQEITIKYFTDGYYEDVAGVLDAVVDSINKELRIYTGFINDTGKELPTIIAFEDILEIGVNIT
ncbi:YolD-like family protein [Clostridium sp. KLE 1755]|uniref:YolD-like family protein n=1 Tax=Clostridia TaxID=186801 RepID=UPI0009F88EEB